MHTPTSADTSLHRKATGLAATLMLLAISVNLHAEPNGDFSFSPDHWRSISAFVNVARDHLGPQLQLRERLDWSELGPEDGILILHPTEPLRVESATAFLRDGGRIALLDDFGAGDQLLERFRIQRRTIPTGAKFTLRNNPDLPIAIPTSNWVAGLERGRHPVAAGVEQLATNEPTGLVSPGDFEVTPVFNIPMLDGAPILFGLTGVIGESGACGLNTGVGNQSPSVKRCGRLFALGDPSVFINAMMRFPGNRQFAIGLMDYLLEDDSWGSRDGDLFVVSHRFVQMGQYGNDNYFSGALERRRQDLDELLSEIRNNGLPSVLAALLAGLAALAAALWAHRSSGRLYRRAPPSFARETPLVAQGGTAGRAAVLSAPTTHRALLVLELKAALEERLRELLRLPTSASTDAILATIRRDELLEEKIAVDLSELFVEMNKAEHAVLHSDRIRISTGTIETMKSRVECIISLLTTPSPRNHSS